MPQRLIAGNGDSQGLKWTRSCLDWTAYSSAEGRARMVGPGPGWNWGHGCLRLGSGLAGMVEKPRSRVMVRSTVLEAADQGSIGVLWLVTGVFQGFNAGK